MNWEAIGAVGELIGAITVVASLIFVGYQLRQGQRSDRAAGQREIHRQAREWYVSSREPGLFEVVSRVMRDWDSASAVDKNLFDTWAFDYLFIVEQVIYMDRDGFINEISADGFVKVALSILVTPGGAQWWRQVRQFWGQDAVAYIDRRMAENTGEITPFYEVFRHYDQQFQSAGIRD